jgi:Cytochrome P450
MGGRSGAATAGRPRTGSEGLALIGVPPRLARDPFAFCMQAAADGDGLGPTRIRDEIFTLFIAGYESTATGASWTWYLLAQHPGAGYRLRAELDSVLAGRAPTHADLPSLPYTRMVVDERHPPRSPVLEGSRTVRPGAIPTRSPQCWEPSCLRPVWGRAATVHRPVPIAHHHANNRRGAGPPV